MPEKQTTERAKRDLRRGRRPTTAAGEFVREEIHHVRRGKHGARSSKQAVAIGLSKARRAGVPLGAPAKGKTSQRTRKAAQRDLATGQGKRKPRSTSARRRRAVSGALKREGTRAASKQAISRQAKSAASRRTKAERSRAAKKGAATKGATARSRAAKKAARTRARRS